MGAAKKLKQQREAAETFQYCLDPVNKFISVHVAKETSDLGEWVKANQAMIKDSLLENGGLLFRNFSTEVKKLTTALEPIVGSKEKFHNSYQGGITTREKVNDYVFVATKKASMAALCLHHEMAYMPAFPNLAFLYCVKPAEFGGSTPVCSAREAMRQLDPKIVNRFRERKVMYIRNYVEGYSENSTLISWQRAFETDKKEDVEKWCQLNGHKLEWNGTDLKVWNIRPGTLHHPVTKEELFFNHIHILSTYSDIKGRAHSGVRASRVGDDQVKALETLPWDKHPYTVAYGDTGTPIETSITDEIYEVYASNRQVFNWRKGDLIVLDNYLALHGRDPYIGEDRTVLAMFA